MTEIVNKMNDSSNTSINSLDLDNNYIHDSEELFWTGMETVQQLETAIKKCKEDILSIQETSEEKRLLVQNLVKLRLRLQDVQEIELYTDPKKVKVIQCHKFVRQSVGQIKFKTSQLYCESCVALIWIPVQSWFCCSDCEYISHSHCLNSIKRVCASVKVNDSPQYILKLCPEKKIGAQNYRCVECKSGISFNNIMSQPHLCDYSGESYCRECHFGSISIIPARVVLNWDFKPRPVSRASEQYLQLMRKKPIINVEAINPRLFGFVEELAFIKSMRMNIMIMKEYLMTCKDALESKLLLLLSERQHFVENSHLYCIQDLIDVTNGSLSLYLNPIYNRFSAHITEECEGCQGKGHICRLCHQHPFLFPFESRAVVCNECKLVYHRTCLLKREVSCVKCSNKLWSES